MTLGFRRRPDQWPSPHERARALAAERIDQPLDPQEAAWLESHLAGCSDCASTAAAYAAQRRELRALRRRPPTPPRDLWARTAAAIEREAAAGSRRPIRARRRGSMIPLGAISGLLVIAVVLGASLLSRPVSRPTIPGSTEAAASVATTGSPFARPTPFDVAAGNVGWMKLGDDGRIEVYDTPVERVCPAGQGAECPPIDEPTPRSIQLADAPASVTRSPKDQGMVVVDSSTKNNGGGVYVLPATNATPSPSPSPVATPTPSLALASATPPATPEPASIQPQSPPATAQPSVTATPLPTTTATASPSATPSAPASPVPSSTATVAVSASPTTGTIQIARDVIVVGESEAYSPDGTWFAFSARPADDSHGPDIYAWRPGEPKATAITTDHRSVFATWLGNRILGSRGVPADAPRKLLPEAFVIDPATGRETSVSGSAVWRPSVDPQRRLAVYWDGSLQLNEAGTEIEPADGRLVLGTWTGFIAGAASPTPIPSPSEPSGSPSSTAAPESPSASPSSPAESRSAPPTAPITTDGAATAGGTTSLSSVASSSSSSSSSSSTSSSASSSASTFASASASPSASPALIRDGTIEPVPLASGHVHDWDARWDETGTHLAVWIATEGDPRVGDLTLYSVDADSGRVQALNRVTALAGFSIGKGRLAWATPRGQDGAGNRVQVVAWTKDAVGSVESRESTEVLVVIR
jgi:outer membrane biosynthesis protein TonB